MPDLASVAERLRVIRRAHRRFMRLWHLEEIFVGQAVLDRVAADLSACTGVSTWGDSSHAQASPHPYPESPPPPAPPGR